MALGAFLVLLALMLAGYGIAPVKYTGARFLNGLRETVQSVTSQSTLPQQEKLLKEHEKLLKQQEKLLKEMKRAPAVVPPALPAPPASAPLPVPAPVAPPAPVSAIPQPMPPAGTEYRPLPYCPKGQVCTPDGLAISQPQPTPAAERPESRRTTVNILSGNSLGLNVNILGSQGSVPYPGVGISGYGYYGGDNNVLGHKERVCEPYPTGCYDRWVGHRPPGTSPY